MKSSLINLLKINSKFSIDSINSKNSMYSLTSVDSMNSIDSMDSMDLSKNSSTRSSQNLFNIHSKAINIPTNKKIYTKNNSHIHEINYNIMLNLTDKSIINILCYNCGELFISQNCSKFCSGECYYSYMYYKYNKFT
jgi:hypothetical protein